MIISLLFFVGLCIGSFICASVWRMHEQMELADKKKLSSKEKRYQKDLSIAKGRSMCNQCHHELAAKDLVPLFSWLYLRARCRYCQHKISATEPLVEVATAVLFVVSYLAWPQDLDTAQGIFGLTSWLIVLSGFVGLTLFDIKWFLLPDKIVLPLTILGAVIVLVNGFVFGEGLVYVASSVTGGVLIAGIFFGLFQYSKGNWIGGGDVKVAFLLGLLAGSPLKAIFIIFLASVVGTIIALPLLITGKATKSSHIPFGPMLLLSTAIVVLFGDAIIRAYEMLFVTG
jgi:prepilin signal peptidase PulO-like enzyme (type II secretory pathway)